MTSQRTNKFHRFSSTKHFFLGSAFMFSINRQLINVDVWKTKKNFIDYLCVTLKYSSFFFYSRVFLLVSLCTILFAKNVHSFGNPWNICFLALQTNCRLRRKWILFGGFDLVDWLAGRFVCGVSNSQHHETKSKKNKKSNL